MTSFPIRNLKSFSGAFQDCGAAKFKMASRTGGGHRGKGIIMVKSGYLAMKMEPRRTGRDALNTYT